MGIPFDELQPEDDDEGEERGPYPYLPPEERLALQREKNRMMSEMLRRINEPPTHVETSES
jgi:hypothetical protein